MLAAIELELIGDDARVECNGYRSIMNAAVPGSGDLLGGIPPSGWIAEIIGFHTKYKYDRVFLKGKKDYSRSNSKGSRGVYASYLLESGKLYDVKSKISWKRSERYYCRVEENGDIKRISEEELIECLRNL